MTKLNNIDPIIADMREILVSADKNEGGQTSLAVHLVPRLDAVLSCSVTDGGTEVRDVFKLSEYITDKPRNADGSESKARHSARNNAIMVDLFGFDQFAIPDAAKSARDKALPAAIALRHYYSDGGKLTVHLSKLPGESGVNRSVIAGIPAADMFELVDDKGELTTAGKASLVQFGQIFFAAKRRAHKSDVELREFMLSYPVETSGMSNTLFRSSMGNKATALKALTGPQFLKALVERARADGVLPAVKPRDRDSKVDSKGEGTDIARSVGLLTAWVELIANPDGETDTPPTAEHEAAMDKLAELWAAYRVNHPRAMLDF